MDEQTQAQFIEWLAAQLGVQSQEELDAAIQQMGEQGIQQAFQQFQQESQAQAYKQGGKLNYLKSLLAYKKGGSARGNISDSGKDGKTALLGNDPKGKDGKTAVGGRGDKGKDSKTALLGNNPKGKDGKTAKLGNNPKGKDGKTAVGGRNDKGKDKATALNKMQTGGSVNSTKPRSFTSKAPQMTAPQTQPNMVISSNPNNLSAVPNASVPVPKPLLGSQWQNKQKDNALRSFMNRINQGGNAKPGPMTSPSI